MAEPLQLRGALETEVRECHPDCPIVRQLSRKKPPKRDGESGVRRDVCGVVPEKLTRTDRRVEIEQRKAGSYSGEVEKSIANQLLRRKVLFKNI